MREPQLLDEPGVLGVGAIELLHDRVERRVVPLAQAVLCLVHTVVRPVKDLGEAKLKGRHWSQWLWAGRGGGEEEGEGGGAGVREGGDARASVAQCTSGSAGHVGAWALSPLTQEEHQTVELVVRQRPQEVGGGRPWATIRGPCGSWSRSRAHLRAWKAGQAANRDGCTGS